MNIDEEELQKALQHTTYCLNCGNFRYFTKEENIILNEFEHNNKKMNEIFGQHYTPSILILCDHTEDCCEEPNYVYV